MYLVRFKGMVKECKKNEVETAELVDDKAGDAASILLRFHQVEKKI